MTIERQIQAIIDDAPKYGVPAAVVEQAIAPVLRLYAEKLQNLDYYVLQNLNSDWVLTTITNSQQRKKVIYAFVSVKDAAAFQGKTDPDLLAMPISVVQLLFRLSSLQQVDSIIFLEDSTNLNYGVEIQRAILSQQIQQQILQLGKTPPNLA